MLLVLSKVLAVLTVFLDGVDTFDIVILDGIVLLLFVVGRLRAALCGLFIQKFKKLKGRNAMEQIVVEEIINTKEINKISLVYTLIWVCLKLL